jgi:hypothetical protein
MEEDDQPLLADETKNMVGVLTTKNSEISYGL